MDLAELAEAVARGEAEADVLRDRPDARTLRAYPGDGHSSVVIKLWKRSGPTAWVRHMSRTGNPEREWRALRHLSERGVSVPRPLSMARFARSLHGFTDAVVIEDMGNHPQALFYTSELRRQEKEAEREQIEDQMIELTRCVLEARVIDYDHHLVNVLVLPDHRIARIDFELAMIVPGSVHLYPWWLSEAIANLVSSYVFAMEPRVELANRFARKVVERLPLSRRVVRRAKAILDARMNGRGREHGYDADWVAPW